MRGSGTPRLCSRLVRVPVSRPGLSSRSVRGECYEVVRCAGLRRCVRLVEGRHAVTASARASAVQAGRGSGDGSEPALAGAGAGREGEVRVLRVLQVGASSGALGGPGGHAVIAARVGAAWRGTRARIRGMPRRGSGSRSGAGRCTRRGDRRGSGPSARGSARSGPRGVRPSRACRACRAVRGCSCGHLAGDRGVQVEDLGAAGAGLEGDRATASSRESEGAGE